MQTQVCWNHDGLHYHYFCFPLDLKRTRDPAVLDTCDIVVDVGAVYDEAKQRFDHHQRGFSEVFGQGFETKLSSAGLIYKCYPSLLFWFSVLNTYIGITEKRLLQIDSRSL